MMKIKPTVAFCIICGSFPLSLSGADGAALLRDADRYADAGNWTAARELYAQAEQAFRNVGDTRNELHAKFGRLHRDVEAASYSRVLQELQTDLTRSVVQSDPALKIRALSLKGIIDLNLNTAAAKEDFNQIRDLAKSLGDHKWENRAVGELGIVAGINGDLGMAGLTLIGAINKAAELHDLAAQLNFSVWLANGMTVNGMADRAVRVLDRAIEAANQNPDSGIPIQLQIARIRALMNLPAGPQREVGVGQAENLIQQTLISARKGNTLGAQAELLNQAGLLAQRKPDLHAAASYFSEAAEAANQADLPRMRADALYHLCEVYKTQDQFTLAESAINSAIAQQTRAQEAFDLPLYIGEKAEVEAGLHHAARANDLYVQATALAESLLVNAPNSQVKSAMIDTMGEIYLGHFRLALVTLHDPNRAFQIVEDARGRALADSMRSRNGQAKSAPGKTAADLQIVQLQSELRRASNSQADIKRLLAKLDQAYDKLAPIEYARDRSEVTELLMPVALKVVQKSLKPGEALVEYVLSGAKESYAFEITSAQVLVHTLPPRDQIERLAREYVKAVRSKDDASPQSKEMFETVIAPALSTHPKSVTIIPDGALHLVPFASIRDQDGRYWMKSVDIASAPSATVFYNLRMARDSSSPSRPFLGVAFSPTDNSVSSQPGRSREAVFGDHPLDLKPLPYAEQEVLTAAQVLGIGSVVLTGAKASESSVKAEPLSDFKIIHVAAHGVSDIVEPDRAGLVLAPENGTEDGFWQAREIRRARLAADLVTLSACETGTGRLQGEEGIMNLARSFLIAGAKSVVASLWDADDRSTATLMTHFYRHVAAGETVADSLRAAQNEMLAEFGEDAKPYFWSGFMVIGDGTRKIAIQTPATESAAARQNIR
jgi:CHAT domain-containing protein